MLQIKIKILIYSKFSRLLCNKKAAPLWGGVALMVVENFGEVCWQAAIRTPLADSESGDCFFSPLPIAADRCR